MQNTCVHMAAVLGMLSVAAWSGPAFAADPVATDDQVAILGESVLSDLLTNDSDADSDPLTLESVAGGTLGTVSVHINNTVKYIPNQSYCSPGFNDTFTYTINDGNGNTDTATVTVVLNCVALSPLIHQTLTKRPELGIPPEPDPDPVFGDDPIQLSDGTTCGNWQTVSWDPDYLYHAVAASGYVRSWTEGEWPPGVTVNWASGDSDGSYYGKAMRFTFFDADPPMGDFTNMGFENSDPSIPAVGISNYQFKSLGATSGIIEYVFGYATNPPRFEMVLRRRTIDGETIGFDLPTGVDDRDHLFEFKPSFYGDSYGDGATFVSVCSPV